MMGHYLSMIQIHQANTCLFPEYRSCLESWMGKWLHSTNVAGLEGVLGVQSCVCVGAK